MVGGLGVRRARWVLIRVREPSVVVPRRLSQCVVVLGNSSVEPCPVVLSGCHVVVVGTGVTEVAMVGS